MRHLADQLLVFALYATTGLLGLQIVVIGGQVSPIWLPTGIAYWALVTRGRRALPAVALASGVLALTTEVPLPGALVMAAGTALEALAGWLLLRRLGFRPELERTRDVFALAAAGALLAPLGPAVIGPVALALAGVASWSQLPSATGVWWVGDAMGALLATPLLCTLPALLRRRLTGTRPVEAAALAILLILVGLLVFGSVLPDTKHLYAQAFLLFPLALWAALRFGPPGAALATAATAAISVTGTALGRGPFAEQAVVEGVLVLQLFLAALALTSLVLAAIHTERQRATEQLILSERMASVGTLAAGIAHEMNNPLTFVISSLEVLGRELRRLDPRRAAELAPILADVEFGIDRVHTVARDLRILSRDVSDDREPVDLDATIRSAVRLSMREIRLRATLVEELGAPPPVVGNPARLGQVFLNLLLNAAQAMPEAGLDENEVRLRSGLDPGGFAFVEVEDTGPGIAPELLPRIFDPFFTTKPSGLGTGLGLPICKRIVAEHGGELTVRSEVGRGTTFRVVLPPAQQLPVPTAPPAPATEVAPGGAILVVDDELRLAESIRLLLAPDHQVAISTDGGEALARLQAGERFDVILCDLHMPRVSGVEFHRQLQRILPEEAARVIFLSGGAYDDEVRRFLQGIDNLVLEKPVRPQRLLQVIEQRLASGSTAA